MIRKPYGSSVSGARRRLGGCEGYRVDSPDGRVGFVEHVCFGTDPDRPESIAVRTGLFVQRSLLVPADEVEAVVPGERRVILRTAPRLNENALTDDLCWSLRQSLRPAGAGRAARTAAGNSARETAHR